MKKIFIILLVLFASISYGQNSIAKFDTDFRIYISAENNSVQETYIVDISEITFVSLEAKQKFFKSLTGNLEKFDLANEPNEVQLTLDLNAISKFNWEVSDWNAYFEKRAEKYLKNYNALN